MSSRRGNLPRAMLSGLPLTLKLQNKASRQEEDSTGSPNITSKANNLLKGPDLHPRGSTRLRTKLGPVWREASIQIQTESRAGKAMYHQGCPLSRASCVLQQSKGQTTTASMPSSGRPIKYGQPVVKVSDRQELPLYDVWTAALVATCVPPVETVKLNLALSLSAPARLTGTLALTLTPTFLTLPTCPTLLPHPTIRSRIRANIKLTTTWLTMYVLLLVSQPSSIMHTKANLLAQEGWGDVRGQSPMSPTRPPSMRKRQSMQFAEMEQRLAMLASENGLLQNAKSKAEKRLEEQARDHSQQRRSYEDAIQEQKSYISKRDSTLKELNHVLDGLRQQVDDLTRANEELIQSREVADEGARQGWHETSRELGNLRMRHTQLASDHENIVAREVYAIREEKDLELQHLREELDKAKEEARELERQILASRSSEDIVERDEDYFDTQCQDLCRHLTSWVTRFSKLSDNKRCYQASEIRNEAHRDLYEDSMLDGSEVDDYLQDRHKRRDVFMSVTMSLIFKHIFARYLFGMDRDHRQKLKTLDKTLQEVGPPSAVHKWRATTLTLLSKRPAFQSQRETDSEGVVEDIWAVLSSALPPPPTSAQSAQCRESLGRIVNLAVDLSIDMRLQKAEYSMLPPPEPDFDPETGDIKNKISFTAVSMNERSGAATSNEELEEQGASLRMVLFPLVVKIDEEDQVVVCPAQVHVTPLRKGKTVRVMSAQGGRSETSHDAGSEDTIMEGQPF